MHYSKYVPDLCINKLTTMNGIELTAAHCPQTDLNIYMEMGNEAIKYGDETECLKWYSKGLAMARQLKNQEKEHLFSNLIITLI